MTIKLFCGKICSGKSYAAEKLSEKENAALLSVDELMLTVYEECLGENHRAAEKRCLGYLLKKAAELAALGVNVIIDHGFYQFAERDYARKYLANAGIKTEWHYMKSDDALRKKRLTQRNAALSLSPKREYIITMEMMARFDSLFEEPTQEEMTEFFIDFYFNGD